MNLVTKTHLFKNAGHSFTCGRTKTEVFEYDDVMHHILVRISIALWTGENDSNTLRVDPRKFTQTGKRISVFKNIRIPMDGALIQVYAVDKGMKLAGVKTKGP